MLLIVNKIPIIVHGFAIIGLGIEESLQMHLHISNGSERLLLSMDKLLGVIVSGLFPNAICVTRQRQQKLTH